MDNDGNNVLSNEITLEFGAPAKENVLNDVISPKAEPGLSLDGLNDGERKQVLSFAEIDLNDAAAVGDYGVAAQNKIAQFSDKALQNVKTKDTGAIGQSLSSLVVEIKSVSNDEQKKGLFGGIRKTVDNEKKKIEKMQSNYAKVETNVDGIVRVLNEHQRSLLKDVSLLNALYDENLSYFKELSMYIIAGNERLKTFYEQELPAQTKKAEQGDGLEIQKLADLRANAERFEKKLHDLKLSRVISLQTAPQIRMIQNNDIQLADKIQSSIVHAIPLWKSQMVIALSLQNAKGALDAQRRVSDLTNEMLVRNSETLRQGSVEIAQESEKSVVSIEAVQKTNENLMATINDVLEIQQKGREQRAAAENELAEMEHRLKSVLTKRA